MESRSRRAGVPSHGIGQAVDDAGAPLTPLGIAVIPILSVYRTSATPTSIRWPPLRMTFTAPLMRLRRPPFLLVYRRLSSTFSADSGFRCRSTQSMRVQTLMLSPRPRPPTAAGTVARPTCAPDWFHSHGADAVLPFTDRAVRYPPAEPRSSSTDCCRHHRRVAYIAAAPPASRLARVLPAPARDGYSSRPRRLLPTYREV
jgi:hypothetical protein